MKTSDIQVDTVYAYERTAAETSLPLLVIAEGLWTMGDEWVGNLDYGGKRHQVYRIAQAERGVRAQSYSYHHNEVGVLTVMLRNSGWHFSITGDQQIVDSAEDLLAKAAEMFQVDKIKGDYPKGERPRLTGKVEARRADGSTVDLEVVITTVLPQQIKGEWAPALERIRQDHDRRVAYENEVEEQKAQQAQRASSIKERLDALLGETKPHWMDDTQRGDVVRRNNEDFYVTEATLIKLIELAEKNR